MSKKQKGIPLFNIFTLGLMAENKRLKRQINPLVEEIKMKEDIQEDLEYEKGKIKIELINLESKFKKLTESQLMRNLLSNNSFLVKFFADDEEGKKLISGETTKTTGYKEIEGFNYLSEVYNRIKTFGITTTAPFKMPPIVWENSSYKAGLDKGYKAEDYLDIQELSLTRIEYITIASFDRPSKYFPKWIKPEGYEDVKNIEGTIYNGFVSKLKSGSRSVEIYFKYSIPNELKIDFKVEDEKEGLEMNKIKLMDKLAKNKLSIIEMIKEIQQNPNNLILVGNRKQMIKETEKENIKLEKKINNITEQITNIKY